MTTAKWLTLFILIFFPLLGMAQDKSAVSVPAINSKEFKGFDKCNISNKLSDTIDRLIATGKPQKKERDYWTFAVTSEVMGLQVKTIQIGVCAISGERSCGWGSFLAVTIKKPLKEAKIHLKQKTGIDFTIEQRSKEAQVTERPVLIKGGKKNESILFCDPGVL